VSSLIGGGSRLMFERALQLTGGPMQDADFEAAYGELLTYYEAHIADRTIPYEGCLAALDELASRGCKLAVITNKIEVFARKLLDELGMSSRFACILGGDTLGPGRAKPAPDMIDTTIVLCGGGRMAMVGDSSFDVRAARAANVPAVALSFGYNDIPAKELGADAVIGHYRELIPALETL
jgi:phosphoglycolate phosphatase